MHARQIAESGRRDGGQPHEVESDFAFLQSSWPYLKNGGALSLQSSQWTSEVGVLGTCTLCTAHHPHVLCTCAGHKVHPHSTHPPYRGVRVRACMAESSLAGVHCVTAMPLSASVEPSRVTALPSYRTP
jgi:hypothetical protein